ncbi:hypothetical protein [Pseudonocardia thermophila]|uniref:hypothetical protein n=1 Tax=Pseudonocardia thermophila TaxID=1848 RepID=UPI001F1D66C1|nr:hypothetical protein [Pseudonocardia thermophila]
MVAAVGEGVQGTRQRREHRGREPVEHRDVPGVDGQEGPAAAPGRLAAADLAVAGQCSPGVVADAGDHRAPGVCGQGVRG